MEAGEKIAFIATSRGYNISMATRTRKTRQVAKRKKRSPLPPVEIYTPERMAEFLLNNSIGADEYAEARDIVRRDFKLDPDKIEHYKPPGMK